MQERLSNSNMEYTINEDGSITRFNLPKELVGRPLLADLKFTKQQLLAIAKLGFLISASDGNISQDEKQCIAAELLQISSGSFTDKQIHECMSFPNEQAETIVKSLPNKQKLYVTAFLITIMSVDYHLDIGEKLMLHILSEKCDLPSMSPHEANNIMINL